MSQQPILTKIDFLPPKPGCKIQVIGAGLPRTGTNSFCAAVSYLLNGPAYHAGVQYGSPGCPSERHILTMKDACNIPMLPDGPQKIASMQRLENILDGYVATADPPLSQLIPELLSLYPDAKVLCTMRDPDTWVRSILEIVRAVKPTLAAFIFFWIPNTRWLPRAGRAMEDLFEYRFGVPIRDEVSARQIFERHHAWLEEIVPKDQLFYVNVKDGWEPICKALEVDVPNVPFPRLNEVGEVDEHFRKQAIKGLQRWAMFFAAVASVAGVGWWYWRR